MKFVLRPWQLLSIIFAGRSGEDQQQVIEYLRAENEVLKEAFGKTRILLDDNQRRRLAVKGKVLGRKVLEEIGSIFTPDTILRWHRELIARKWDYSDKRGSMGRPATPPEIADLILQFARENPRWGYDRIADALANIGHHLSDQTVGNVLKANGIEPAPQAEADHLVVDVSQGALESTGSYRLHDGGSVDLRRPGHLLPAVRHAFGHAAGLLLGLYAAPRWQVDGEQGPRFGG